jgi:hypothetical protein
MYVYVCYCQIIRCTVAVWGKVTISWPRRLPSIGDKIGTYCLDPVISAGRASTRPAAEGVTVHMQPEHMYSSTVPKYYSTTYRPTLSRNTIRSLQRQSIMPTIPVTTP